MRLKQILCRHKVTKDVNKDYMDWTLMEYTVVCAKCDKVINHWVTGSFEYDTPLTFKELINNIKYKFIKPKYKDDDELPF